MMKILLFLYLYEYLRFQCEGLSPFKCSLSRLIHTNEWRTAVLKRIRIIDLFQAGQLDKVIARKKLMSEAMFMKNIWMFMMTVNNRNERND